MLTKALTGNGAGLPAVFDDFFKPWNEWFDVGTGVFNRTLNIPAVNIKESKDDFKLSFAVPGMKKDDFHIGIEGNMLTISSEKEEHHEEKEDRFTRKEYNYSTFSRSFSLPEYVQKDNIQATYTDGILQINLPKKEEVRKSLVKNIVVR
jgi:HSP20 family protein